MQSRQLSRAQDNELVDRLRNYLFLDRTVAWDADLEKKVEALTPEQIVAAMRKYIDPAKISIVKAGDFAKEVRKRSAKDAGHDSCAGRASFSLQPMHTLLERAGRSLRALLSDPVPGLREDHRFLGRWDRVRGVLGNERLAGDDAILRQMRFAAPQL